jgi:autotransporter-associated beta strand protein
LALEFRSPSIAQARLRRGARVLGAIVLAYAASLASVPAATAQSLWNGTTSTYETNTNWVPPTTPPSPPVAPGQQAVFDAGGSPTVNVTSSAIAPDSWTFNTNAQSYTTSGGAVNFSRAGSLGGLIDNASAGQTITIQNNIGESVAGVQLQLNGSSTLVLLGTNTYTGGTFINSICGCGTLQLGDATHTASIIGDVSNAGGTFNIVNANTSGLTSITNTFGGLTQFFLSTNAGTATITNAATGGSTLFFDNSSAGNATIINKSSSGSFLPVGLGFFDQSTAANATIINTNAGFTAFGRPFFFFGFNNDSPTAANATITNTKGSEIFFGAFATAGNAVITTDKGSAVVFVDRSTGGNAQFITNGTGVVDFGGFSLSPSSNTGPKNDGVVTAGSIAGSGTYIIGGITLVVGSNNLSTTVSGVIADTCGCGPGPSGNLTKVGSGTLTLSGTNTYTGVTTVAGGTLLVTGSLDSSRIFPKSCSGVAGRSGAPVRCRALLHLMPARRSRPACRQPWARSRSMKGSGS